jgi:gentisate 1,2-dioxygenase
MDSESRLGTLETVIEGASKLHAVPLWPQMVRFNPPVPDPKCVPHVWSYEIIKPYLVRAGELVKDKDAERRGTTRTASRPPYWQRRSADHVRSFSDDAHQSR